MSALRPLLSGIVDYAGLFPPAGLDMATAVRKVTIERGFDPRDFTMIAFGGPDMKTLYCTSASIGRPEDELAEYPLSGALFSMRTDVAGLARPLFNSAR